MGFPWKHFAGLFSGVKPDGISVVLGTILFGPAGDAAPDLEIERKTIKNSLRKRICFRVENPRVEPG